MEQDLALIVTLKNHERNDLDKHAYLFTTKRATSGMRND
jgi:hypothetical protein